MKYILLSLTCVLVSCTSRVVPVDTRTTPTNSGTISSGTQGNANAPENRDDSFLEVGTLPASSGSVTVSSPVGEASSVSPLSAEDVQNIRQDMLIDR